MAAAAKYRQGEDRGGQWRCVGALEAAGCRWWQRGRSAKQGGRGEIVIFRAGHVLGLRGQEARCFVKPFFLLSNFTAENTQPRITPL
jgi:hypothetical protein